MQLQKRSLLKGPFISLHLILSVFALIVVTYSYLFLLSKTILTIIIITQQLPTLIPEQPKHPKKHTLTHKKTHKFFTNKLLPKSLLSLHLSLSGLLYNLVIFVCGGGGFGPAVVGKCRR